MEWTKNGLQCGPCESRLGPSQSPRLVTYNFACTLQQLHHINNNRRQCTNTTMHFNRFSRLNISTYALPDLVSMYPSSKTRWTKNVIMHRFEVMLPDQQMVFGLSTPALELLDVRL